MLYPEAERAVADALSGPKPFHDDFDLEAERRADRDAADEEEREPVERADDLDADGVPCRLYVPRPGPTTRPGLIVHLHGGGFCFNDVEVHDAAARRLANRTGLSVCSVDYRRPPEHRFPAAPDDVDTVLGWLAEHRDTADGGPTYLHGDSAGANLALVGALRNPGRTAGLVLVYPFLDPGRSGASYAEAAASGFDEREAAWYWEQYAASPADFENPDLAPLLSEHLHTLPPTLVVTAEHDPLRDEGEELAARLAGLDVPVVASRQLGQVHGFWRHPRAFAAVEPVLGMTAAFLAQHP